MINPVGTQASSLAKTACGWLT